MSELQHTEQGRQGAFFLNQNGQQAAELTYQYYDENTISIDHTWVDPSLRGQGVAKQLMDAAITFARDRQLKIIPRCSYAVAAFERDKSLHDVLAQD